MGRGLSAFEDAASWGGPGVCGHPWERSQEQWDRSITTEPLWHPILPFTSTCKIARGRSSGNTIYSRTQSSQGRLGGGCWREGPLSLTWGWCIDMPVRWGTHTTLLFLQSILSWLIFLRMWLYWKYFVLAWMEPIGWIKVNEHLPVGHLEFS